jgi:PadR family transcriptional regulator, regulatory protein PadR
MPEREDLAEEVARWRREISKGGLRLALLSILNEGESYGYQILATLQARGDGVLHPTEAAVYPMLKDLERGGYLLSRWHATGDGVPPRKYYRLSASGNRLLLGLRQAWQQFRDGFEDFAGGKG